MQDKRIILSLAFVIAGSMVAPAAFAHPLYPDQDPEAPCEVRLLHNAEDTWGPHAGVFENGHDLIALDVWEIHDEASNGPALVFQLYLDGGFAGDGEPTLRNDLHFNVDGEPMVFSVKTDDNTEFYGDFDDHSAPVEIGDGTRFYVLLTLSYASMGLDESVELTDFEVIGYADGEEKDRMPQTGGEADHASYQRPEYPLKGRSGYAVWDSHPRFADVPLGGSVELDLRIHNCARTDQSVSLQIAELPSSVEGHFPEGDTVQIQAEESQRLVPLSLTAGDQAQVGPIELILESDQGASSEHRFTVSLEEGSAQADPDTEGTDDEPDHESTPAPVGVVGVFVAFGLLYVRGRGHHRSS